jgi:hypothetical protein
MARPEGLGRGVKPLGGPPGSASIEVMRGTLAGSTNLSSQDGLPPGRRIAE